MKIIIDTDIADDIDDTIAIAFALGSPEIEILGINVVYGDVAARSRVIRKMLQVWNREDIPVARGAGLPLIGEYYPGSAPHECSQGELSPNEDGLQKEHELSASDFIIEQVRKFPGEINIMTIGAMTNVAAAFQNAPDIINKVKAVYSIAGYHSKLEKPEWNVKYDPQAAQVIAESGVPWTVIGASCMGPCNFRQETIDTLNDEGTARTHFLLESIALFNKNNTENFPHVCDIGVMAMALDETVLPLKAGTVSVADNGALAFDADEQGPHRIATALISPDYRPIMMNRLLTGA